MCACLHTKFQVSSMILTSLDCGGGNFTRPNPPEKKNRKSPPRLGLIYPQNIITKTVCSTYKFLQIKHDKYVSLKPLANFLRKRKVKSSDFKTYVKETINPLQLFISTNVIRCSRLQLWVGYFIYLKFTRVTSIIYQLLHL